MDLRLRVLLRAANFIHLRLHRRVQDVYGPTNWWQDKDGKLHLGWDATELSNRVADGLNQAQGVAAQREP